MELHLFLFLFVATDILPIYKAEETNQNIPTSNLCDEATGGCTETDNSLVRHKREALTAHKLGFLVQLSTKTVDFLGKTYLLEGIEQFLHHNVIINPHDIFQLDLVPGPDLADVITTSKISFVLQPHTQNVEAMKLLLNTMIIEDVDIGMRGHPLFFANLPASNETIIWDNVKTVASFLLDREYDWLEKFSLPDGTNEIATNLNQRLQLNLRDIFDLTLKRNIDGKTMVEFAFPPVMTRNRAKVLKDIKAFVISPCGKECKQSDSSLSQEACETCQYFNLFGVKIYPDPNSFISTYELWTGNEIRFEATASTFKPCPDHMELCTSGRDDPKCVGIGRCDIYFYKSVQMTLEVYGSIQLLDIYGLDFSANVITDSLAALHDLCRSAMKLAFSGKGRDKFAIHVIIEPYLGRNKGVGSLEEMIITKNEIEIDNLVIAKVEGSYRKKYLDLDKQTPKYFENECFGCPKDEVWCLFPNISMCVSKNPCIDDYYDHLKISSDTQIVRFNLLMTSDEEFTAIGDDQKYALKLQISEQINCSVQLFTEVDLVQSEEEGYTELGFVIMSLNDNKELKNAVINVHKASDKGVLYVITPSAVYYAVPETVLFRQYISGYPKPSQERLNSPDLGNNITGISFIVLIIFTVLIACIARKTQPLRPYAIMKDSTDKDVERTNWIPQHVATFMRR